jgi:hypothetical protein
MPQKEGGFAQALWDTSSTQKEMLGRLRRDGDRWFSYAKNGAVAGTAGWMNYTPAPVAGHLAMVCVAAAVGDFAVAVTPTSNDATADQYKDGYLHIDNGAGIGQAYRIASNPAITATASGIVALAEPVRTAITTASTATFSYNNQMGVLVTPAATATMSGALAGVFPRDVAASYYFWNQVKGPCAVSCVGTLVIGNVVISDWHASTGSKGSVLPVYSAAAITDVIKGGFVGTVLRVNATGTAAWINLTIPGY